MGNESLMPLVIAVVAFVGSHFLLSHPLRKPLAGVLGERGFAVVYSLVALGLFGWMAVVFAHTDRGEPLWDGYAALPWIVSSLLMLVAIALFAGSIVGNPALPQTDLAGVSARKPMGVLRITRHPMMWSFAIWALAHVIVSPSPRVMVLAGGMAFLALVGAHFQDVKKSAQNPREWNVWRKRTSYWPTLSAASELARRWYIVLPAWLLLTWAHLPLGHVPAGVWRWVV